MKTPNYNRTLSISFMLVLSVLFFGCDTARTSDESQIIEGCEYIVSKNSYGNSLTHKGNCSNPIHKCTCQ